MSLLRKRRPTADPSVVPEDEPLDRAVKVNRARVSRSERLLSFVIVATMVLFTIQVVQAAFSYFQNRATQRIAQAAEKNTSRIAALQKKDTETARNVAFRSCERGNLTRADIQNVLYEAYKPRGTAAANRILAEQQRILPIVDCTPNLVGRPAVRLERKEQTKYREFFVDTGGLPPLVRAGRVLNRPVPTVDPGNPESPPEIP